MASRFLSLWRVTAVTLELVISAISAGGAQQQKTDFLAYPLKGAQVNGKQVQTTYSPGPGVIEDDPIEPGDCIRVTLVRFVDKPLRLGTLFDRHNPLVLTTSSTQGPMFSTLSDAVVAYEKSFSGRVKLMENIPIYGPAFADGTLPLRIELKLLNVEIKENKSFVEQAVDIAVQKIHETRAFAPLLNEILQRVSRRYNANVKPSVNLNWITQSGLKTLHSGFWVLLPTDDRADRRFLAKIQDHGYYLLESGDVVDRDGNAVPDKEVPLFLVIRLERLEFNPILWRGEFGNIVQSMPTSAPQAARDYLRQAAEDAAPVAEEYLFSRLMEVELDLLRTKPVPTKDEARDSDAKSRVSGFAAFLKNFTSAGFISEKPSSLFKQHVRNWLDVAGGDQFPEKLRNDAMEYARVLFVRAQNDVSFSHPKFLLTPVTLTDGRFRRIQIPVGCVEGECVKSFVKEYLKFLDAGEVYLPSEWSDMRQSLMNRFEVEGADNSWKIDNFRSKLSDWAESNDPLVVENGKVKKLGAAKAVLWKAKKLLRSLPSGRLVSAEDEPQVRIVLQSLTDYLDAGASDQVQRDSVEKQLRSYTAWDEAALPLKDLTEWVNKVKAADLLYDSGESPPFFMKTPLRVTYIATKKKHEKIKGDPKLGQPTKSNHCPACPVLGGLLHEFPRTPSKTPVDNQSVTTWCRQHTTDLPPLEGKQVGSKQMDFSIWLRSAVYDQDVDKWAPPANSSALAAQALYSLTTDVEHRQLTAETFAWAAETFSHSGDSLPANEKKRFSEMLSSASDLSEQIDLRNEDKTKPSFWGKVLKVFNFRAEFGNLSGARVALAEKTPQDKDKM